ncbi:alpha-amylase family glycosyl hydrolase [Haladaptatus caseinilyticus]|uniref:alpha-amylase family glycosyl hydrolase n=1 Tax=Haladaptatus caseinilyticus TaxID=2993314 RepID=UPI00224B4D48|nr:alpha-amylase family glycosyl hydrolase [Haladaptatus caseinilyticus]
MYKSGPPRFTTVGEAVELAPREPDPTEEYEWTLESRPKWSSATISDSAVIHFEPDHPGLYRLLVSGADEKQRRLVRAFPDERWTARFELPVDDLPIPEEELDSICITGPFNEHLVGRNRPKRENGAYVFKTELPPGEHPYGFLMNDDLTEQVQGTLSIPGPGRPRIHLDGRIQGDEIVVSAEPKSAPNSDFSDDSLDVEIYVETGDGGEVDVVSDQRRLRIPRKEIGEWVRIHAVAVGDAVAFADCVEIGRQGKREVQRLNDPPKWAESPTIYEIFVRLFAGETVDTTFAELERRIPYLESLNVDCVWLTPILASPTDHGYHTTNYFETASDLGTREEFESFVSACHEADIRVIFDLVINHSSRDHPAFQMSATGVIEYRDWYVWETDEETGTQSAQRYFNWERIPNFNFDSLAVRTFLLDVVDEWAGMVDGFRCDVAWGVPHEFWKEVAERVPDDFLLLDETIPRDPAYHEGEFTMHYDTTLYGTLRDIGHRETPATAIFDALSDGERAGFPDSAVHLRYVENHDESRYLDECGNEALKAATAATFTLPGAPMIYYGQERGMTKYRGTMRWEHGDDELTEFHRALSRARNDFSVLRDGSVERIEWESNDATGERIDTEDSENERDGSGIVAFSRKSGDDCVAVVLNFGESAREVTLGVEIGDIDLVTGETIPTMSDNGSEVIVENVVVARVTE